ncbi:hypothetical protein, partial [uncultured Allobaculum sp.]|uniref:hypothetical protein n=1 Tax=uncultured Allobaculum sp. TaxID=1187017 RepID=UPI00260B842D
LSQGGGRENTRLLFDAYKEKGIDPGFDKRARERKTTIRPTVRALFLRILCPLDQTILKRKNSEPQFERAAS